MHRMTAAALMSDALFPNQGHARGDASTARASVPASLDDARVMSVGINRQERAARHHERAERQRGMPRVQTSARIAAPRTLMPNRAPGRGDN
jgi:hypothetical protein